MAAALAAASIIFRKGSPQYANSIVATAKELFVFATTYEGKYSDWVVESQAEYNSSGYMDEIYWAASWLYFASGDESYMNDWMLSSNIYVDLFPKGKELPTEFNWDVKTAGVLVRTWVGGTACTARNVKNNHTNMYVDGMECEEQSCVHEGVHVQLMVYMYMFYAYETLMICT